MAEIQLDSSIYLYKAEVDVPALCLGEDKIVEPSATLQDVITQCSSILRPGWEYTNGYFEDNLEIASYLHLDYGFESGSILGLVYLNHSRDGLAWGIWDISWMN